MPSDRRYATPTGDPCPRSVRCDGTLDGSGDCHGCGFCLLVLESVWPSGSIAPAIVAPLGPSALPEPWLDGG